MLNPTLFTSQNDEKNTINSSAEKKLDKFYLSFWDVDDTLIRLDDLTIKNSHLLLPIMLFQSIAPNQQIAILTNRSPNDPAPPKLNYPHYFVKDFVEDVANFGIRIPNDYVIFGGGTNSFESDYIPFDNAISELTRQLESLKITTPESQITEQLENLKAMRSFIQTKKYHGKNFHITQFLQKHAQESQYKFKKGSCSLENLQCGMIDDMPEIAEATAKLGTQFFGIKATGKEDLNDDYYSVDYLHQLASAIGFTAYATNFALNEVDHPMLQMACLLYLWQCGVQNIEAFKQLEKKMSNLHCEQIANMLDYISLQAKKLPQKSAYIPVDSLLEIFQAKALNSFVKNAFNRHDACNRKLMELKGIEIKEPTKFNNSQITSQSESTIEPKSESKANRRSGKFQSEGATEHKPEKPNRFSGLLPPLSRKKNRETESKPALPLVAPPLSKEDKLHCKRVEEQKEKIVERLKNLSQTNEKIGSEAGAQLKAIETGKRLSNSVLKTSASDPELLLSPHKTYAPQQKLQRKQANRSNTLPNNTLPTETTTNYLLEVTETMETDDQAENGKRHKY